MHSDPYVKMKSGFRGRWANFLMGWLMVWGVSAQSITETRWYFGNSSQNLVFDLSGRDAYLEYNNFTPFGTGGSTVITDQFTGNLLFYSDGEQLFDGGHNQLSNTLSGTSTINVPTASAPVSGNPGQYYVFTNSGSSGVNAIEYSIVDANLQGNGSAGFPLGAIVSENNGTGLSNPSEGMIVIPLGDGVTFWLISQDRSNFQYRVTPLNNGGIGATINYDFTGDAVGMEAAHFSFNADSSFLAVAPKTANRNVRILDFDTSTGVLSFRNEILNTGFNDGQGESVYDLEWSNDGSKLYLSRFGSTGTVANVYQVDLADPALLVNSIFNSSIYRSYGLQRGLDGRIYHLYQSNNGSSYNLGRINYPDSLVASLDYQSQVFGDDFNGQQFPNFTAGYFFTFNELDFTYLDSCQNNYTKFFPIVDPVPQQYFWDFTGGSVSDDVAPILNFGTPGGYNIRLTAIIAGISQTVEKTIAIIPNTTQVDLGNDTTICVDEILPIDAGDGIQYLWSTGATTRVINVDTAGTYWVEVIGPEGCPAYDEIEVTEYGVSSTVNNQWYFGEQAGIDFTNGAVAITDENIMYSPEGCASVSDINGELLFYTNGQTVWNREHMVMIDGDSIGGDSTAVQAALIVPFTDESTMYYVFTSEEVYGTGKYQNKVAIVDMKKDTARGQVLVKNIALNNYGSEKLTVSSVTSAGWLLTHELGNNVYRANLISDLGISSTVYSPVGETYDITDEVQGGGAMKFSNGSQIVGATLPKSSGSFVELLDFDPGTGSVSNPRLIDLQESDPAYGLEFSQDLSKLYVTTLSASNSKLIQYDLDSLYSANPATDIQSTKYAGYATGQSYGSLQMGPDGTIYMAVDNSTTIGTIASPSGNDDGASFDPAGFDLLTRASRLGLPNFTQEETTTTQEAAIVITPGCFGEPSYFSGIGRDNSIEEYSWLFGDGTFAIGQDTSHVYASPGTYTVQLTLFNRCDVDTVLYQDITISQFSEVPQVPLDTFICDQPIVLSAWPIERDGYQYNWSTGETTREITVSRESILTVFMISPAGCISDTVFSFVADGRPMLDIGPNLVYCIGDSPPDLDATNPGDSFEWQRDGVAIGNNTTQSIETFTAGIYEYTVAVTDPVSLCIGRDTVEVTILGVPNVTITPTPTQGCGNDDGSMAFNFNESGNFDYNIQGPSPLGPFNVDISGSATINHDLVFAPGNYTVDVTNTVTGCVYSEIVQVEDPTALVTVSSTGNCDGDVELTLANTPANFSYDVLLDGVSVASGNDSRTIFSGLNTGVFSIEVIDLDPNFCVETEEIEVVAGTQTAFTFDANQVICGNSGDIFIVDVSGATYSWAGPAIVGGNIGPSVEVSQSGIYTVTATQLGYCDRSEDIEVIVTTPPTIQVDVQGDQCDGQLQLTANVTGGTGPFTYSWNTGQQGQQINITESGLYQATVRDQSTGCSVVSSVSNLTVRELLEVSISATPDCEDNGRIILDAISPNTNVFYVWNGPNGSIATAGTQITVSEEGIYEVTIINSSGSCQKTFAFDAILTPIEDEDILLPSETNFCSVDTANPGVELYPGIFNTYEWTKVPDPTVISTAQSLYVTTAGTYEVTLYNGFTCTTDRVVVKDDCRPVIYAPTAFTPNGDGLNDAFAVIPNPAVQDFKIVIVNRWGEPVFASEDMYFRWDGTLEGNPLTPGTYTYRMTFRSTVDSSIGQQDQYGAVVLVR